MVQYLLKHGLIGNPQVCCFLLEEVHTLLAEMNRNFDIFFATDQLFGRRKKICYPIGLLNGPGDFGRSLSVFCFLFYIVVSPVSKIQRRKYGSCRF